MSEKKEKSPAFQFYPKDFLTDDKVIEMSAEVLGLYIKLLCIDWLNDGFYGSAILKLAGYDWLDRDGTLRDDSIAIERQLLNCFEPHPTKVGYVTNPRIVKERKGQEERRNERSASGKKGAAKKWAVPSDSHDSEDGSAINQPMANDSSSSPTASASPDQKENNKKKSRSAPNADPDPNLHPSPDAPAHLTRKPYELKPYPSPNTNCFLGDIDVTALKLHFAGSELRLFYFVAEIDRLSQASPKKWRKYVNHRATILSWDRLKTERGLVWVEHPTDGQRAGFYPHYVATKIGHEAH